MTAPYFSFLLCSHKNGALIQAYINGLPLGTIRDGVFEPHGFVYPQGQPVLVRIHDLPCPFPFETFDEMKAMLHEAIDKLSVVEPAPIEATCPECHGTSKITNPDGGVAI